jgi:hypothetical protein
VATPKRQMSNPFLATVPKQTEADREHRHQFQTAVYAILLATACFLMGMLIQGCNDQKHLAQATEEFSDL